MLPSIAAGLMIAALVGLGLTFADNEKALKFLVTNGTWLGLVLVISSAVVLVLINRRRKSP
jgi:hypothetical protein